MGAIAHLPAASASRVSRQVPPNGVTAPVPLTQAARTSLSDRTGKPGLQHLAAPLDQAGVGNGHERERQLRLDRQLAVDVGEAADLSAVLAGGQPDRLQLDAVAR